MGNCCTSSDQENSQRQQLTPEEEDELQRQVEFERAQSQQRANDALLRSARTNNDAAVDRALDAGAEFTVVTAHEGNSTLHEAALRNNTKVLNKLIDVAVVSAKAAKRRRSESGGREEYNDSSSTRQQPQQQQQQKQHKSTATRDESVDEQHDEDDDDDDDDTVDEELLLLNSKNDRGFSPLICAASTPGRVDAARVLLDRGADIEQTDNEGNTPFIRACWSGDPETVKLLLNYGCESEARNAVGYTGMAYAVAFGRAKVVDVLIRSGCSLRWAGLANRYMSPRNALRELAVSNHHVKLAATLEESIAAAAASSSSSSSTTAAGIAQETARRTGGNEPFGNEHEKNNLALIRAVQKNDVAGALYAINKCGADVSSARLPACGSTPIKIAAESGYSRLLKLLLQPRPVRRRQQQTGDQQHAEESNDAPDVNVTDNRGWTPLMRAAAHNQIVPMKLLLAVGADVEARDDEDNTAFIRACSWGGVDTIRLLVETARCDKEAVNAQSYSGLAAAVEAGRLEVVAYLISSKVRCARRWTDHDKYGANPRLALQRLAADNGHTEVAQLLEQSLNADEQAEVDWDLLEAARVNDPALAKQALTYGANINCRDGNSHGKAALNIAATNNHLDVMRVLIEFSSSASAGSDEITKSDNKKNKARSRKKSAIMLNLDQQDDQDVTPLRSAAFFNHVDAMRLLVDAGASIDLASTFGYTAFLTACQEGRLEAAKFLLIMGCDPEATDRNGYTGVALATMQGHEDLVELLAASGCSLTSWTNSPRFTNPNVSLRDLASSRGHDGLADFFDRTIPRVAQKKRILTE